MVYSPMNAALRVFEKGRGRAVATLAADGQRGAPRHWRSSGSKPCSRYPSNRMTMVAILNGAFTGAAFRRSLETWLNEAFAAGVTLCQDFLDRHRRHGRRVPGPSSSGNSRPADRTQNLLRRSLAGSHPSLACRDPERCPLGVVHQPFDGIHSAHRGTKTWLPRAVTEEEISPPDRRRREVRAIQASERQMLEGVLDLADKACGQS